MYRVALGIGVKMNRVHVKLAPLADDGTLAPRVSILFYLLSARGALIRLFEKTKAWEGDS
jgi:hypothetical protein